MILYSDPKTTFWYQLTEWLPTVRAARRMASTFECDPGRDCTIREKSPQELLYAVYTDGAYVNRVDKRSIAKFVARAKKHRVLGREEVMV